MTLASVGGGAAIMGALGRVLINPQIAAPLFMFHLHRLSKKDVPRTALTDEPCRRILVLGRVLRKCPLAGSRGGVAHVSQFGLGWPLG